MPAAAALEMRKQISIFVPLSDWKNLRMAAARRRLPITELCRRQLQPLLHELRQQELRRERRTPSADGR